MKTDTPHRNNLKPFVVMSALASLAVAFPAASLMAQDQGSGTTTSGSSETPPPPRGGPHLLPPHAAERLNLTDAQKKQIKDLEAEVKTKIESILTPAQLEQLKQMHPPHGGGPGGGNPPPPPPSSQSSPQSTP